MTDTTTNKNKNTKPVSKSADTQEQKAPEKESAKPKKKTTKKASQTKSKKNDKNDTANTTPVSDPDLDKLHAMSDEDQLWFFIDDVVPTKDKDTEVIICEDGITDCGMPLMTLAPKSMEIFEEIANIPNHAAPMYPNMTKYFADIIRLYNTVVRQDINPYWSTEIIDTTSPLSVQLLIAIQTGGYRGFLSLEAKPNSIPIRLHYGDSSHKHDFVGIVYLYATP